MSRSLFALTSVLSIAALFGCAPSGEQLKKAIEKDPSIVFVAIEKDPQKFMEVVNKAAQKVQGDEGARAAKEAEAGMEEAFKNPLKPEIDETRVIFGAKNAKITIVEYSDFQCPYCSRGYQTMKQVLKAYPSDVRILFKHLPLEFHDKAMPAAQYFEAIAKQSSAKAEKFHDTVFENQDKLNSGGVAWIKETAKKLGLDMKKVEADLASDSIKSRIAADVQEAQKFGIQGTPGFIINGVPLKGAYPFEEVKKIIDRHLGK